MDSRHKGSRIHIRPTRVHKGNPSLPPWLQKAVPSHRQFAVGHHICIVHDDQGQGGEAGPPVILTLEALCYKRCFRTFIYLPMFLRLFQCLYAHSEHHIPIRPFLLILQPACHFLGGPPFHLHHQVGSLLKFLDDGFVYLFLLSRIENQVRHSRHGSCLRP